MTGYVRYQEYHLGTVSGSASEGELAVNLAGPLAHAEQPPVPTIGLEVAFHAEPLTIVDHRQSHPAGLKGKSHPDRACGRMLDHVGNRLLRHSNHHGLHLRI